MLRLYGFATRLWNNRKNRDTPERRAARAVVAGRSPCVVVTGGSRGIGLAIAREFLSNGRDVLLVARDAAELDRAAQSLDAAHRTNCTTLAVEVTLSDVPNAIDAALEASGLYLDVLVNNAASGVSGPFAEHADRDLDALVQLNVAALTRLTHHALPMMIARGQGGIINIASLGGYVPGPYQAAYYASKAYVLSLSEAVASEISGRGVHICTIAPGPVATGFHADMDADRALYRQILPELTPERVARAAYRAFTIGQRVVVPGIIYRLAFLSLRVLPHAIAVPLTGVLLKNPER